MSNFTLYTTPLSANGRKVLAVCHHLGLRPEIKLINVYKGEGRAPEYLAVNPLGKIPALVEGDFVLWESNAILQYLAEAHGDYRLWSREPARRADIARWLYWESAEWQPALVSVLRGAVASKLGLLPPGTPVTTDYGDARFVGLARFVDAHLATRRCLLGDELTIADFSVAGMLTYARAAEFPFTDFANLTAWYERIEALSAWQETATSPWAVICCLTLRSAVSIASADSGRAAGSRDSAFSTKSSRGFGMSLRCIRRGSTSGFLLQQRPIPS